MIDKIDAHALHGLNKLHTLRLMRCHLSFTWWRHQMETFSALLAICAGNSLVAVNSPHKGQWRGALMFSFISVWINDWVNNREAGDLRRHHGHYDVNVIMPPVLDVKDTLRSLSLRGNMITFTPGGYFKRSAKLEALFLGQNYLVQFPDVRSLNETLKTLYLSSNCIPAIKYIPRNMHTVLLCFALLWLCNRL